MCCAREVAADPGTVSVIDSVLQAHGVPYRVGKTWTTDAFYRETRDRVAKRTSEGCIAVEMECAAFLAVAEFRGVPFGQLMGAEDDVSGEEWDRRKDPEPLSLPERLFWLSVEVCLRL